MPEDRRRRPQAKDSGRRGGAPTGRGAGRDSSDRRSRSERPSSGRSSSGGSSRPQRGNDEKRRERDRSVYDGPAFPPDITGQELDRSVTNQLKGIPEKLAARVARHLAAAGALIEDDPETAYQHALAARARAPRVAVVREAVGESAYASGHYAEALSDLRAAKRMNGSTAYLPIMADCHRALGHPERALELAKSPSVAKFEAAPKAEMTLVESGARRDQGDLDAALRTLELAPLSSNAREPWVVRLRYAYADTLEAAGRDTDALTWFHRTDAIDAEELTDAADRAAALERRGAGSA